MARISITLLADEREVLITLSERERRSLRDEAAILLRERLIERGLLPVPADTPARIAAQPSEAQPSTPEVNQ